MSQQNEQEAAATEAVLDMLKTYFAPAADLADATASLTTQEVLQRLRNHLPSTFEIDDALVYSSLQVLHYKTIATANMQVLWLLKRR